MARLCFAWTLIACQPGAEDAHEQGVGGTQWVYTGCRIHEDSGCETVTSSVTSDVCSAGCMCVTECQTDGDCPAPSPGFAAVCEAGMCRIPCGPERECPADMACEADVVNEAPHCYATALDQERDECMAHLAGDPNAPSYGSGCEYARSRSECEARMDDRDAFACQWVTRVHYPRGASSCETSPATSYSSCRQAALTEAGTAPETGPVRYWALASPIDPQQGHAIFVVDEATYVPTDAETPLTPCSDTLAPGRPAACDCE